METVEGSAGAGKKILKGPRACSTCARAKSRCIPGPARQEKCERCHRLRKPCSSQTPAPPRKRKEPKPTRVSELERRLEDLTARMESVQRAGQAAVPSPPESDHYVPHTYPPLAPDDPPHPRNISGTSAPIPTFGPDSPFGHIFPSRSIFDGPPEHEPPISNRRLLPATTSTSSPAPPGPKPSQPTTTGSTNSSPYQLSSPQSHPQRSPPWPEGDEAETLLGVYREHMAHLFPFAVVPPHLTSAQMRERRPLFWKAIMMEAHLFDGPRQVALGNELLREISEAAFMKPQKNLDLLQGLQMLIAWYHYNLNNFQMVNLLFLARSITTSLGSAELKGPPNQAAGYDSESLEQMRAFAGTYYLVTITFTTNKRPDALMNTSYLATCCRALHGQMEYPTDELVVHLVRAQQLSQSISQGFARRKAGYNESQMSQAAFIQGLQDRIQGFAAALPPHIRTNPSLTGHLHVAEILVYENRLEELSRCEVPCCPGNQQGSMASSPESVNETTPEHVKMLWACARVVRTFLTNRFAREAGDYPRFIRLSSFDLTYVFLTMLKMVTLQVPGWDLARVREELHFDEFVTRLVKHMEHTSARRKRKSKEGAPSGRNSNHDSTGPENEAGDMFTMLAGKIRFVKDHLHANGFDSAYATSQVARVCDPAPMTLADATQDLLQDLGGGLWQDLTTSTSEWDLLFVDEAVDWAAVFSDYNMAGSGYLE